MKQYFNHFQKETLFAGTSEINIGQIKTYNALGIETVFLGTNNNDAGLVGVNNNSGRLRAFKGVNEIGNGLQETKKINRQYFGYIKNYTSKRREK